MMFKELRDLLIFIGVFLLISPVFAGAGLYLANTFDAGLNVTGTSQASYTAITGAEVAGWNNLLQRVNPQTPPTYWIWLGNIDAYGYAGCNSASISALVSSYGYQSGLQVSKDPATGSCTALQSKPLYVISSHVINLIKSGTGSGTVTSNPAVINCGVNCFGSFAHNAFVYLTALADAGSLFAGWGGDVCNATSTPSVCTVGMSNDKTVVPVFEPSGTGLNTLIAQRAGTGSGKVTDSALGSSSFININCGTDCSESYISGTSVIVYAYPNSDSTFVNWFGCNSVSGNACTATMSAVKNARATFGLKIYKLDVARTGTGNGTVLGAGINCGPSGIICSANLASGNGILLTASPDTNSKFESWSGCDYSAGNYCVVDMFSAKSVSANFSTAYAVSVTKNGGAASFGGVVSSPSGIDCGSFCFAKFVSASEVTLTASISGQQYKFTGWGGDCLSAGSSPTCTLSNLSSVKSVFATFDIFNPILIIGVSGTGSGNVLINGVSTFCSPSCSFAFNYGDSVTIAPSPSSNSVFSSWGGGCSGLSVSSNCAFTMTENKNAGLVYDLPTLTLNKSGSGQGLVKDNYNKINCDPTCATASAGYNKGHTVVLTATADNESKFFDWSGCDNFTSTTCTIVMNSHRTVTATFLATEIKYSLNITKSGDGTGLAISSPAGISCGTGCLGQSVKYAQNTTVTLLATADPGYIFSKWTGCDSPKGNSCVENMNAEKNVNVEFIKSVLSGTYTLNVFKVPDGGTVTSGADGFINCGPTSTCSKTLGSVWSATLTETPNTGYQFTTWSGDCSSVFGNSCVINFTQCQ